MSDMTWTPINLLVLSIVPVLHCPDSQTQHERSFAVFSLTQKRQFRNLPEDKIQSLAFKKTHLDPLK